MNNDELEVRLKFIKRLIDDFSGISSDSFDILQDKKIHLQHSNIDDFLVDSLHLEDMIRKQIVAFLCPDNHRFLSVDTQEVFSPVMNDAQSTESYALALSTNAAFFSEFICQEISKIAQPIDVHSDVFAKSYPSILPLLDDIAYAVVEADWWISLMCARGIIMMKDGCAHDIALQPLARFVEDLDEDAYSAFSIINESLIEWEHWSEQNEVWLIHNFINGKEFLNFTKYVIRSDWDYEQNIEYTFSEMYGEFEFKIFQRWLEDESEKHGGFLPFETTPSKIHFAFCILYRAKNLGYDFSNFMDSDCAKYLIKSGQMNVIHQIQSNY